MPTITMCQDPVRPRSKYIDSPDFDVKEDEFGNLEITAKKRVVLNAGNYIKIWSCFIKQKGIQEGKKSLLPELERILSNIPTHSSESRYVRFLLENLIDRIDTQFQSGAVETDV